MRVIKNITGEEIGFGKGKYGIKLLPGSNEVPGKLYRANLEEIQKGIKDKKLEVRSEKLEVQIKSPLEPDQDKQIPNSNVQTKPEPVKDTSKGRKEGAKSAEKT